MFSSVSMQWNIVIVNCKPNLENILWNWDNIIMNLELSCLATINKKIDFHPNSIKMWCGIYGICAHQISMDVI